jgi:hypothetical protein
MALLGGYSVEFQYEVLKKKKKNLWELILVVVVQYEPLQHY